jgi:hypothetical protein
MAGVDIAHLPVLFFARFHSFLISQGQQPETPINWRNPGGNAMKMKMICIFAAILSLFFLSSISLAQGGQPDIVGDMDKDGDGKVSATEWNRNPDVFKKYDKNSDGFIASDEKPGGMPDMELLDIDADGKITLAEFPGPENIFKEFDKDGNGFLVESETAPPGGGGGAPPGQ